MTSWFATYWWAIWALLVVTALIIYRVRKRGGEESFVRRIEYALFRGTDPANPSASRQLSLRAALLVGAGLLLIMLLNLLVLHSS